MTDRLSWSAIERIRVSAGFLANLDVALSEGLNCFIGGRGTGKTTALEFIRFGLLNAPFVAPSMSPRTDGSRTVTTVACHASEEHSGIVRGCRGERRLGRSLSE